MIKIPESFGNLDKNFDVNDHIGRLLMTLITLYSLNQKKWILHGWTVRNYLRFEHFPDACGNCPVL